MVSTIDKALADKLVTVVRRDDQGARYSITIGELTTVVHIALKRQRDGKFEYRASHAVQRPDVILPYRTNFNGGDDAPSALRKAVKDLTMEYRLAVREGHQPSNKWLVEI